MREGTADWGGGEYHPWPGVPGLSLRAGWAGHEYLPWAPLVDCNFGYVNQIIPFLLKLPLLVLFFFVCSFFLVAIENKPEHTLKIKYLKSWWETKIITKINNNNSNNKNSQNLGEKAIISAPGCYSQGWVIWCFGNGYLENWLGVLVRRTQDLLLTGVWTSSSPTPFWSLLL